MIRPPGINERQARQLLADNLIEPSPDDGSCIEIALRYGLVAMDQEPQQLPFTTAQTMPEAVPGLDMVRVRLYQLGQLALSGREMDILTRHYRI